MTKRLLCPPEPGPLEAYAERFDDCLGTVAQRRGFREYLQGLLLPRDRHKTLTGLGFDELFLDWDGGPLTPSAFQCVLKRLKAKLGLKRLSAHQFRPIWATNYRKHQVGDLFSLQQEGGWEDLEVPQRFYVDTSLPRENRASVMDHLELEQRKDARTRRKAPIQVVAPVQGFRKPKIPKTVAPRLCQANENVSEGAVLRTVPAHENVGEWAGLLSCDGVW
jgi:hypothetical protein